MLCEAAKVTETIFGKEIISYMYIYVFGDSHVFRHHTMDKWLIWINKNQAAAGPSYIFIYICEMFAYK